jgi:hypothetical protein
MAADTIEVLDNLQFEHLNTATINHVHADGFAGQAVESVAIPINAEEILGLRVIVNNNYGATGSTIIAKARMTGISGLVASSTPTKYQNIELLDWTSCALAAAAIKSTEADLSTVRSGMLHLFCALNGTTAHLGTEFIVQVRNEATVNEWTKLFSFVMCAGKIAILTAVASTAAAGQKVIPVTNPTTALLNHINKNLFIMDATIANCEIVFLTVNGGD